MKKIFRFYNSLQFFIVGLCCGIGLTVLVGSYLKAVSFSHQLHFLDSLFDEQISQKFQSYATKLSGKQSLYVAHLQELEMVEKTSHKLVLGLHLPDATARLQVPVEYTFYIPLSIPWKFSKVGNSLSVFVPELSNGPPAADISHLQIENVKDSIFHRSTDLQKSLQEDIQALLIDQSIALREKVREQARDSIRQFLKTWLSQVSGQNFSGEIQVYFPKDTQIKSAP